MARIGSVGDLEISEDIEYQKRAWAVRRIAWPAMTLVVVAALAGLFGTGPASSAAAGVAGGALELRYQRFARAQSPTDLTLRVGGGGRLEARVWIDSAYLAAVEVRSISPEPERIEAGRERSVLVFSRERPEPFDVVVRAEPQRAGRLRGAAGLPGGPSLSFTQFVYP